MNLSIIIPAYNEEESIERIIKELKQELNKLDLDYEMIVVNDASIDKTGEILKKISNIKIIEHPENRGYGASLKSGFKKSQGELILIIDADGTYPNESIPELIKYASSYDMVIGARTGKQTKIPLIRKPAKWILNRLANYLSESKIPDLNSGLRIMKRPLIEKFLYILPNGFSFTTTITLASLTNGYNVKYLPINYLKRRGKSKFRPIRDTLNFFQLIIRTILYFNPLKIFVPLSSILVLSAVVVFVFSYFFAAKIMDVTIAILLISAIQLLAIGMIADLITKRKT
ncbi:MAG: glycosyltransferase family 2 protein [Patescibacteria group bacterium]